MHNNFGIDKTADIVPKLRTPLSASYLRVFLIRCKLDDGQRMPGAGLSCRRSRKAPLGKPTFQPYWRKPAVQNDRENRGNVGTIRSPLRASILPDSHYWPFNHALDRLSRLEDM